MMFLLFLCVLLIAALSTGLYVSVRKNLEYMEMLEDAAVSLQESIDDLNVCYAKIDRKSKLELFLDEPITRELVEDIKGTKKAVKAAAEKISVFIEDDNEEES